MVARRVFLVDNEKAILVLLGRHLERSGYLVETFVSAEEALAHREAPPDIVVADQILPGMSGVELGVEWLTRVRGMVCLLCSGYPLDLAQIPAPLRERIAFLHKPFPPDQLTKAIQALTDRYF